MRTLAEAIKFRIELLWALWKHRRRETEDNWIMPLWELNLHRLKCAICLFLPYRSPVEKKGYRYSDDAVTVAYTGGGSIAGTPHNPSGYWFEALCVGYGWRNWWWDMYQDSSV